jgi:tRNA nucleotidyltransferase (CCA-adding enzyme)
MRPVDLPRSPAVTALEGEDTVYVVGGAVRDLLLGREPHELDFVVEGDALEVARRIGGRVIAHERFGTATVSLDGATFDLASARRERYPRPGALPEVELGATLREDLERRDFTVNAIALHLRDGELTWLPGAREDLDARRLRVLHDGSFVDDPTRLLRLARYSARLGFEPEEHTDRLAAEAIDQGALDTVTGSRLGAELRLLLQEPQPAALQALERQGLGAALLDVETELPSRAWRPVLGHEPPRWPPRDVAFEVRPDIVKRAMALTPPDGRADLAALAASLGGDRKAIAEKLDALAFPAGERDIVAHTAASAGYLTDVLEEADNDAALWTALRKQPPETVALAGAYSDKAAAAARRWLDDVRHRRLAITGDDIVAAGLYGPAVGEALDRAMVAMLLGEADTREGQLAAALG